MFQFPGGAIVQRMDDSVLSFQAELTVENRRLALKNREDEEWTASFLVERPVRGSASDRLVLEGELDHHRSRLELRRLDDSKFLLVSRGFHWVQERPFNR
ncbi:MAG TPA: hypothetical protein VGO79_09075 [Thermoanaerobaculia bacterium]